MNTELQKSLEKPTAKEREALRQQVRGIVLAQGNIFIRELLRSKGLKIGATKKEFEGNLVAAIDSGQLQRQDVDDWMDKVEGWGNQHVYLFDLPDGMIASPIWNDRESIREIITRAGHGDQWHAQTSREFPGKPTLTGIFFFDGREANEDATHQVASSILLFEWHERDRLWIRDPSQDYEKIIQDDEYKFQAQRKRPTRSVMRFGIAIPPGASTRPLAALFIPLPINDQAHNKIKEEAWNTLEKFTFNGCSLSTVQRHPWSISNVIKNLDQAIITQSIITQSAGTPQVKVKSTKLASGGASVEFTNTHEFAMPGPVMHVRLSIQQPQLENFDGYQANFMFKLAPANRKPLDVRVELHADSPKRQRLRIWPQLENTHAWTIIKTLQEYAR